MQEGGCVRRGWAEDRSSLVFLLCTQVVKQEDALNAEWESPLIKQNLETGLR